jgi:hypothetical protein
LVTHKTGRILFEIWNAYYSIPVLASFGEKCPQWDWKK